MRFLVAVLLASMFTLAPALRASAAPLNTNVFDVYSDDADSPYQGACIIDMGGGRQPVMGYPNDYFPPKPCADFSLNPQSNGGYEFVDSIGCLNLGSQSDGHGGQIIQVNSCHSNDTTEEWLQSINPDGSQVWTNQHWGALSMGVNDDGTSGPGLIGAIENYGLSTPGS